MKLDEPETPPTIEEVAAAIQEGKARRSSLLEELIKEHSYEIEE
jgi:hypothetical protein